MFITPCSLTWVQVGSSKAGPQLLACYDRDVTRRKKMAPRVQRGEKKKKPEEGWQREETHPTPPSSPTQVHTHCRSEGRALRASPRLRQGAHMPGAQRRTQRKNRAPKCTCSPPTGLCLAATLRALEWGAAAGLPADTARPGDPCLLELPHWDPRTTFSRARRCPCHCTKRAQGEGRLK